MFLEVAMIVSGLLVGSAAVFIAMRSTSVRLEASLEKCKGDLASSVDEVGRLIAERSALETRVALTEERLAQAMLAKVDVDRLRVVEMDHERLKAGLEEREAGLRVRSDEIESRFSALANEVLERSHAQFLLRAEETLLRHREFAGESFKENSALLEKIVSPMRESLSKYDAKLAEIEQIRASAYGSIVTAIAEMKQGQERVQSEAARLTHALRNAPKARGRWGEHQLRQVMEMAGLVAEVDFSAEVTVDGEDGKLRPDAIIKLPGGKLLVIDAKCPLSAYQDAAATSDDLERAAYLRAHAATLRTHVNALSRKAYWDQFESAPDFVIMFIPGENFLAAALEADSELFEFAFAQRVLLASPTNLIAIARTVAMVWRQERLAEDFKEVGALGKELYERLATFGGHVTRVGKGLDSAVQSYNQMVGSLESKVMTSAKRFVELNIEPPRNEIETLVEVESVTRNLTKLDPN